MKKVFFLDYLKKIIFHIDNEISMQRFINFCWKNLLTIANHDPFMSLRKKSIKLLQKVKFFFSY